MIIQNSAPFPLTPDGLPTPILEYTFNSDDFTDSSGNGYDGTGFNLPTFVTGKDGVGKSVSLDGVDQYFRMPRATAWNDLNGKDFSFTYWMKVTSFTNNTQALGNLPPTSTSPLTPYLYFALLSDGSINWYSRIGAGVPIRNTGSVLINDSNFHYIVGRKTGTVFSMYVDDALIGSFDIGTEATTDNTNPITCGAYNNTHSVQLYDSVRFYDYSLSTDEMTALYEGT